MKPLDSSPPREQPGEPDAVRLMNTIWADTAGLHDDLSSTSDLQAWLQSVRAYESTEGPGGSELRQAQQLRDALRRLAAHVTNDTRPHAASATRELDEAIGAVNAATAGLPQGQLARDGDRLRRAVTSKASPVSALLATVADEAITMLTGPTAEKLRACYAPGCVLYFVKSHPRRAWCSDTCGNRVRAARHYQRIRSERA
jgi:predicted RNA-binding Zn ribbon-like protein